MRAEDGQSEGTLAQQSFTQILVRALDQRWTGTLLIEPPFDLLHFLQLERGLVSRVLVPDDYARLGELLVEAGAVMESELELALAADDLLGQALVSQDVIDEDTLQRVLVLQVLKRLVRVFDFPEDTEWSFLEDLEAFEDLPDGTRVDSLRVLWAGLSAHGEMAEVQAGTLDRLGSSPFQLRPDVKLSRFGFTGDADRLVGVIAAERCTLQQLEALKIVPPEVVRSIIYLLAISRHLDYSPAGESQDSTAPLSTPASSGGGSPSSEGDEQKPRQVARIALRKVTLSAAAPDPPGTGEQTSRPSSEGSVPARGDRQAHRRPTAPALEELKSLLAGLDRASPFSLLGVAAADLEGKEDEEVTAILSKAYEGARRWHPDRCPEDRPDMEVGMKRLYGAISEAYAELGDPDTRARCLAARRDGPEGPTADSVTSGLRSIERPGSAGALDLSATTPSATAPSEEPPSSAPEPDGDGEASRDDEPEAAADSEPPPEGEEEAQQEEDLSAAELHERALQALSRDQPKEALELSRRACEAEPDNPDYGATSLWIQAKLPRPDLKVLTLDLDDLLRTHLDHVAARYYRGVLRRRLSYDSAAKQDFERVLDLEPDHAGAKAQLAELGKGGGRRR